jgi:intracellular sulfur oxidation DsrE/DsrF family protein
MISRRKVIALMSGSVMLLPAAAWAQAKDQGKSEVKSHRLALQISDNSVEKMNGVLNVAANVSRYYDGRGEEIEIIAFDGGMHMLRADTSPVKERIANFRKGMPNVRFVACRNTMDTMERSEGRTIQLLPQIDVVEAGVTRLIELNEQGWTLVKP